MKYLVTLIFVLSLAACDSKIGASHPSSIDGSYTSLDGRDNITFTSDGKAQVVLYGKPKETTYTLQDNVIKYQFEGGMPRTYALNPDGSLTAENGTTFKKK